MSQLCREKLLKSIQAVHLATMNYANCLCEDISEEDKEVFFRFGTELSFQLKELRRLYTTLYGVDPLSGFAPIPSTCGCAKQSSSSQ